MGVAKNVLSFCWCVLLVAGLIAWLVFAVKRACTCITPFRASVDEASLSRLSSLAAPGTNNGSTRQPASLAYDLALVVALRRNTQAVGAIQAAPLDAELRFLGRPLARARLAGAEWEAVGGGPRAGELRKMVYRLALAWNAENATQLALGGPGEAAMFAAESAAGEFELELAVDGDFKSASRFRPRWCQIRMSCPLRLSVSTVAAPPAPFERVECASS